MRPLVVLVPAILAALLGAPSSVSAASNDLLDAGASPTSGTTTTVFKLRVDYVGLFPAVGVDAQVAGLVLEMELASGTLLDGHWLVSTTLPAGTWPVVFTATSEHGNAASLVGPTITVAGDDQSPGSAAPVPMSTSPGTGGGDTFPDAQPEAPEPGGSPTPALAAPGPTVTDAPAAEPTTAPEPEAALPAAGGDAASIGAAAPAQPAAGARDATETSAPSGGGEPRDGTSGGDDPREGGSTIGPVPSGTSPAGRLSSEERPGGRVATPTEVAEATGSSERAVIDDLSWAILVALGWLLAFGFALAALAVVAARRRRDRADEAEALLVTTETAALLERRALRRAKLHLAEEDPIVAALGIRDEDEIPRPRRSGARRWDDPAG